MDEIINFIRGNANLPQDSRACAVGAPAPAPSTRAINDRPETVATGLETEPGIRAQKVSQLYYGLLSEL